MFLHRLYITNHYKHITNLSILFHLLLVTLLKVCCKRTYNAVNAAFKSLQAPAPPLINGNQQFLP